MSIVHLDEHATSEQAHRILERDGVVVIDGLAPEASMAAAEQELAPWLERPLDQSPLGNDAFSGFSTLRTSGLIAKSQACGELVMNHAVLAVVDHVLGPQCARFQLSFSQAICIGPGEAAQVVHRDTTMYPLRRPGPEVFVNTIWALSDFTAQNGATRFHLGSHHWEEGRIPGASDVQLAAEMSRGSAVLYYGSCWHGGGANLSAARRSGIAFGYTLGWLRQEENQYLAVPPDKARTLPVELQRMLGYAEHYPFLGWYEGQDHALFRGGAFRKRYASTLVAGAAKSVTQIMSEGESARSRPKSS